MDDARQNGANIVYTYDALKRLTKATTAAWTQNVQYDGFGNITAKDAPSGSADRFSRVRCRARTGWRELATI